MAKVNGTSNTFSPQIPACPMKSAYLADLKLLMASFEFAAQGEMSIIHSQNNWCEGLHNRSFDIDAGCEHAEPLINLNGGQFRCDFPPHLLLLTQKSNEATWKTSCHSCNSANYPL